VPMNGTIPAKDKNGISLAGRPGHANLPFNARVSLKWSKVAGRTPQSKNGRRAHVRG